MSEVSSGDGKTLEMNTDVADVVQNTIIPWVDKNNRKIDLRLDNFGFDDWSAVQSRFTRDRRANMILAAISAGQALVEAAELSGNQQELSNARTEAEGLKRSAMQAASSITGLHPNDWMQMMQTVEGHSVFLWVMIERRYPGLCTLHDAEKIIRKHMLKNPEFMLHITTQVQQASGLVGSTEDEGKK